jgi:hypothetical protein
MLKKRTPGSRVVGIALKDRSAILMAGPRADAAYWFDVMSGGFETSTYYAKAPPAWLTQWNARRLADSPQWRTWTRLLPDEAPYLKYAGPDAVKGEYDNVDIVFPHRSRQKPRSAGYYDDLRRTPFGDEILLDAALAAMTAPPARRGRRHGPLRRRRSRPATSSATPTAWTARSRWTNTCGWI